MMHIVKCFWEKYQQTSVTLRSTCKLVAIFQMVDTIDDAYVHLK